MSEILDVLRLWWSLLGVMHYGSPVGPIFAFQIARGFGPRWMR